jgi:hypothetical protein
MAIQNIPVGVAPIDSRNYAMLPMLPNGAIPSPIAIRLVTAGVVIDIPLAPGTTIVVIGAKDNNCFYRFKTATDTADVTKTDLGNARGEVLAWSQRVEAPVTGATSLSVICGDGSSRVTVEQRA